MFRRGINPKRPRFTVGGHTIFEGDDSSNHSGFGLVDYDDDSSSQQHTTSTNSSDPNSFFAPDRPRRSQKSFTKMPTDDNTNLNACLDYLFRTLSRKDKEGFFQYPVTDQVNRLKILSIMICLFDLVRTGIFTDHYSTDGFLDNEEENSTG